MLLNKDSLGLGVGDGETLFASISPSNATNRNVTWSSSNTAVATVTGGYVVGVSVGSATITVRTADGNYTATCNVTISPVGSIVYPTRVTLDKVSLTIPLGGSAVLTPTIEPANATNKNVEWHSNNLFTATVSGGVVTAGQYPGQATITVRSVVDTRIFRECNVTVYAPVTGVTLDITQMNLEVGISEILLPIISPSNAQNIRVSWSSSNPAVATVTQGGWVTGISAGTAVITVETEDGGFKATCNVTVGGGGGGGTNVPATGVTLNKSSTSLGIGGSEALTATVAPSGASNKNVTWESSNEAVATVTNGLVTGVSVGVATITVRTVDGNFPDSCTVTVSNNGGGTNVPVAGVELNKRSMSISIGGSEYLAVTIKPDNATNQNVYWGNNNPTVATVVNGLVTGLSVGVATITVTTADGYFADSCTVTVFDAGGGNVPVTGVELDRTSVLINVRGTNTITAKVLPENATNKNVSWFSGSPAIATVNNGVITGVSPGSVTITVRTAEGSFESTCEVSVMDETFIPVTGISLLDQRDLVLKIGEQAQLSASVIPENATIKDINWESTAMSIATITQYGLVTALATGNAIIYASPAGSYDDDVFVSCNVTVLPADPSSGNDIVWVSHQNSTKTEDAAGKMPGFTKDNLEIIDGNVAVKRSIAENIFKEQFSDKIGDAKGIRAEPLPWFEASVDTGQVAAVRIPVNGSQIYYNYAKDILLLKVITPTSGDLMKYATTTSEFDDGYFTFMEKESDTPFIGFISLDTDYDLVVFIKDGGVYDLDNEENGYVVDPIVQVRRTYSGQDDDDSGCNTFGGSISLLLVALKFFTPRRKK
ncbi:MAG: Ig-like domain-containing protein [Oscillospiraceae bacterium]|nr:Ig-like domain-containing protein [Oscillospiraceae bacterium]